MNARGARKGRRAFFVGKTDAFPVVLTSDLCHSAPFQGRSAEIRKRVIRENAAVSGEHGADKTFERRTGKMKILMKIALVAIGALGAAACTETPKPAANGNTAANANTNANTAAAKPPATKEALVALEKKAFDAWKTHDGKFFEGFLNTNFVMVGQNGKVLDKAATVKEISESKCDT